MANRDVPSAEPPTLLSYEIPGGLRALKQRRKEDAQDRPPASDYERGSYQDRQGNRGL
jgi:hypothetical protein